MDFRIIRDKIPIYSVDASYMLDKTTGYIKISRFAATTVEEFEKAVKELQEQGMKDLVLDLQEMAVDIWELLLGFVNIYYQGIK